MKKLIGKNIHKTVIFISGKGTNLLSLIKFSYTKNSPIKIEAVISDKSKAKGLNLAKKYNIEKFVINFKKRSTAERKILAFLNKNKIDLVCLAGFMKILSKNFIKKYKGKILNIHPSLLPKYKGLNTHERVIKNKEKYSGCTVHFVNSKLDSGKIILQKKVKITKKDNSVSLSKKILKQEHILYPRAIKKIFF
tara:strand:+ start:1007 stop:1585 length:579 start_codon:yes stop_codon:yes gene_type:complete